MSSSLIYRLLPVHLWASIPESLGTPAFLYARIARQLYMLADLTRLLLLDPAQYLHSQSRYKTWLPLESL